MKKQSITTYNLVLASLFAALCCLATMLIQIPAPVAGYVHFGDVFVLLSGWLLGGYGVAAAGIGSMLADILTGYAAYAPITFIDKAATAAVAWLILLFFKKVMPHKLVWLGLIVSAVAGELVMAFGYTAYEIVQYGFGQAIVNLPANLVQGAFGVVIGCVIYPILTNIMGRLGIRQKAGQKC